MGIPQAETPMMRQFLGLKRKHPDKILFFRMGDFYEMFGEDAVVSSKVLQIALTSRDKKNKNPVPMCGIPYHAYEQYLNKLTTAGYKVAICEQMEDPSKVKGLVKREIVRIVTPGTTVSPQLVKADQNHYLLAINHSAKSRSLGAAFVDVSTGEFEVCEFKHEQFTRFYDFVVQLQPSEVLLPQSRSEQETKFFENLTLRLGDILVHEKEHENVGVSGQFFNFVDPYYFDNEASARHLKDHFKILNLAGFGIEKLNQSLSAAGALLRYLEETQKCNLVHITAIKVHRFEETMLLDETSVLNLELFENQSGIKRNTLYAVLNRTCTSMGARLLRQWIRHPLLKVDAVEERLDCIDVFRLNFMLCIEFRELLKTIQDLPRIMGRISLPVACIADMVALRESLEPLQTVPGFLSNFDAPLIKKISETFDPLEDILKLLHKELAEKPSSRLREGGYMATGLDEKLDELRSISRNSKQFLNELLSRERNRTGITSLKISYNKIYGYYIEVSHAHKFEVPEEYIRKQTLVNAERYITQELKEFEEKILNAEGRIAELEYSLFLELKERVVKQTRRVQESASKIAILDVLAGWADLSEHQHYTRPKLRALQAPRFMEIEASRHPVIELIDLGESFVPNDLYMSDSSNRVMLITGPNMSGKSTYMRQIALNVLMAQCGCFVPADHAEFSMFDRIFTRVGASDNLSLGQSTFMMEMNEVSSILHNAGVQSLVILDEVGRGTSTFDGISIAWATVEYLHGLNSLTLCATHYHELTALSNELEGVENFSVLVEEDVENVVFLRKIVSGEANKSYGVQVARLAGLPDPVVRRAKEIMLELEDHSLLKQVPEIPSKNQNEGIKQIYKDFNPAYNALKDSKSALSPQLSLFGDESAYVEELRNLEIDTMTPLEALNYLSGLIKYVRGG